MLKCLVIFGFLLAVAQASNPLPGKTSAGPGNSSGNTNADSQNKNGTPNAPVPVVNQSQTPINAEHTGQISGEDTQHSVTLTSVPPLTINGKKKAFLDYVYDWGPWFFGLFLAIAGGVQLRLLRVTWKAIQEQKAESARQTVILKESVAAAQKSADAAEIQAKAAMGVAVPTLVLVSFDFAEMGAASLEAKLQHPKMRVVVKNYGQTPAFLKSYALEYSCGGIKRTSAIPDPHQFEDGTVIEAGKECTFQEATFTPWEPFSIEDVAAIVGHSKILCIVGCLRYGDVFGSPVRELIFCKELADFSPGGTDPLWVECDLGEKYRLSTENEQSQKPN